MARYCIFSAQYTPHVGGIERYTEQLAKALVRRGNSVDVVTNDTEGLDVVSTEGPLTIMRLPCVSLFSGRLPLPKPSRKRREALNWVRRQDYDGILINARFYPHSILGMQIAHEAGLRPVVLDHGSAYLTFGNRNIDVFVRLYEHLITACGKKYNPRYFGVSSRSIEWLRNFGIEGEGVLPNSIDSEEYRSSASSRNYRNELALREETLLVAFVGRLIPEKGIHSLLEAARIINELGLNVHFVFAGTGPLERDVCSSGNNVTHIGRLSQPDVCALLLQADVLCLPSRSEGFATCLLESGACGTPAISTDVGGMREVMPDDSFGIVLPSSDADEVVSAIQWCACNRESLEAMGKRVKNRIDRRFSWNETAALFEKVI